MLTVAQLVFKREIKMGNAFNLKFRGFGTCLLGITSFKMHVRYHPAAENYGTSWAWSLLCTG